MEEVDVDEVGDGGDGDAGDSYADEDTRQDLGPVVVGGRGGPREPEEARGKQDGSEEHGWKAVFGDHERHGILVRVHRVRDAGCKTAIPPRVEEDLDENDAEEEASEDGKEW